MALGVRKDGTIPGGNIDNSLNLLQLGMNIDGELYHPLSVPAKDILIDSLVGPRFLAVGGVYWAGAPSYIDGEAVVLRFTSDGKLMTDASITIGALTVNVNPTQWTQRYYIEADVTNVDQTLNFGFGGDTLANEIILANDDNSNSVWFNYGAAAIADASHDKVLAAESFTDNFASSNIHLITNVAGPIKVRVWARKV